jgi:signal transduction histidine kinase
VDACENVKDARVEVVLDGTSAETFSIRTKDNGCGMSEAVKKKLFQMFSSTKGSRGTGLGLPVTRKIITEHKGRIDVDSQEGVGTTFTVTLPRRAQAPA